MHSGTCLLFLVVKLRFFQCFSAVDIYPHRFLGSERPDRKQPAYVQSRRLRIVFIIEREFELLFSFRINHKCFGAFLWGVDKNFSTLISKRVFSLHLVLHDKYLCVGLIFHLHFVFLRKRYVVAKLPVVDYYYNAMYKKLNISVATVVMETWTDCAPSMASLILFCRVTLRLNWFKLCEPATLYGACFYLSVGVCTAGCVPGCLRSAASCSWWRLFGCAGCDTSSSWRSGRKRKGWSHDTGD